MRKLYKSSTNKRVMGVCAGVADYLKIDPTLVRIIMAIAFFVYGVGFIPYIVLGIILPYDYQVTNHYGNNNPQGNYYRNTREKRNLFSSLYSEFKEEPKDVTPKEDPWDEF